MTDAVAAPGNFDFRCQYVLQHAVEQDGALVPGSVGSLGDTMGHVGARPGLVIAVAVVSIPVDRDTVLLVEYGPNLVLHRICHGISFAKSRFTKSKFKKYFP